MRHLPISLCYCRKTFHLSGKVPGNRSSSGINVIAMKRLSTIPPCFYHIELFVVPVKVIIAQFVCYFSNQDNGYKQT